MESERLLDLLNKYNEHSLTNDERQELENWYNSLDTGSFQFANDRLKEELLTEFHQKWLNELPAPAPVRRMHIMKKISYAAAIVAGIGIIGAAYFLFVNNPKPRVAETIQPAHQPDIAPPSGNKAILILGNGSTIALDSAGNGMLAVQGKINIVKQENGQIEYRGAETGNISYNTLSLPNGSRPSKLVLSDGSKVWLNTASSITYPTAFAGKERRVKITGEAYFEIAKNAVMPFYVGYKGGEVRVLGTHFNVNAYADEMNNKITLLEGSVLVSGGNKSDRLQPGQQAQVAGNAIKVVNEVNIEEVMSWKDGRFYFDGTDIKTIMRQVEKWYNVQVKYESDINELFVAKISREENLSALLRILQLTNLVHFKIEGNTITVTK